MWEVENSSQKSLNSFVDIREHHIPACPYANVVGADYFCLMVLNDVGEMMIIEDLTANSAWGSWHLVTGELKNGENSVTAVKRKLLEETGYISNNWLYMGSYMLSMHHPHVAGHFFMARNVVQMGKPHLAERRACTIRWISSDELKHALLDGRIGMLSYAVAASLALLHIPVQSSPYN